MGALDGLKVADFSWVLAGPSVGRMLADHGATVVRVESATRLDLARLLSPFKDGVSRPDQSALAADVNAGKFGVALNLATPEAQEVARKLAGWCDVMIESFSPGTVQKWQLDYQSVSRTNPGVVMLSTSLFGQSGPLSRLAGYGSAGAAFSGIHNLTGWPDRLPSGFTGPYTDFVAPRFSLAAILAALDRRRRTGQGAYIDVSQTETGIQLLGTEIARYHLTGEIAQRAANRDRAYVPNNAYPCSSDEEEHG